MKTALTISILVLIVFACHRKTIPPDNIIISNKTNRSSINRDTNKDVASAGQTIYINRCGRCHSLKNTEKYTQQQWEAILKNMIPKARLNAEEAKQVTAYLMKNAKQ